MELLFLGLIGGAIISYFIFLRFSFSKKRNLTEKQSVILLDKIKRVLKLITVQGEFSEIYHHENTKEKWMGMFTSKKKALILINAKAHIGFDFKKMKMVADSKRKTITVTDFPQPEVLSLEPDLRYYDMQNGMLNKFDASDLTALNKEAKEHILNKIPESNLMETASKEALEAIHLMENLVETIGWSLDYSQLELPMSTQKKLKE
ncbi:DUF4230 domain-containing protein [Tenacibaculum aquimarinum]|uniref:DUF4230 domain-containing protein n=1 Tax=Tenacibaculum aquimarinum TaxID=2910675 RepID=UPI001F0A3756|nr:DUF4230 domain-containing protein [Tenacibaculum aquimarinum]MCH3880958.1 DUF4230 domain-containing protein [Tenacibaculum aquimarinum]MCH3884166.1 DUF4230 domain-containing protein [Tenacibaculum aquimarinum]